MSKLSLASSLFATLTLGLVIAACAESGGEDASEDTTAGNEQNLTSLQWSNIVNLNVSPGFINTSFAAIRPVRGKYLRIRVPRACNGMVTSALYATGATTTGIPLALPLTPYAIVNDFAESRFTYLVNNGAGATVRSLQMTANVGNFCQLAFEQGNEVVTPDPIDPPPGGEACGPTRCGSGTVCCNSSCGICTAPGGACSWQACN